MDTSMWNVEEMLNKSPEHTGWIVLYILSSPGISQDLQDIAWGKVQESGWMDRVNSSLTCFTKRLTSYASQ